MSKKKQRLKLPPKETPVKTGFYNLTSNCIINPIFYLEGEAPIASPSCTDKMIHIQVRFMGILHERVSRVIQEPNPFEPETCLDLSDYQINIL